MRHLIQICNLATGSKVVSWTGSLNSQLQLRELRNHCVRIYAQLAPLKGNSRVKTTSKYRADSVSTTLGQRISTVRVVTDRHTKRLL